MNSRNCRFKKMLGEILFNSWPDINLNKNVSELQMFTTYFNMINKEDILKTMRNTSIFGNDGKKNINRATVSRKLGNELYNEMNFEGALNNYNESISLAPRDSKEFGLAVANRSAVFFDMEKYKECLEDIIVVLKTEYPKELRYKIFLRQTKCCLKLNLNFEAAKSLRRAQESVDELKISKVQRKSINDNIIVLKNQLKEHLTSNVSGNGPDEYAITEPSLKEGENPKFVNASKIINFKYTKKLGRHVVANTDIKQGDVLFIEEPYNFVPVYESLQKYTICAFCLQKCLNCVPCTMCTDCLYCSDDCRQNAWDKLGHRWECLGKRRGIIMNDTMQVCCSFLFNAARDGFQTKVNDESVYGNQENNYPFVNKLLTNKNTVNDGKLKTIIRYSVWLVLYLKNFTDYFDWLYLHPSRPEGSKDDLLKTIGGLLVKYILQLMCNAVFIAQRRVRFDPDDFALLEISAIGFGIYVSSALINHSCLPNCADSFCGTKRVIKATKDIKKGTEVTINYLASDDNPIDEDDILLNKKELRRFEFECSCRKCTDPDYEKLFNAYLCPRCSGKALIFDNTVANCIECNLEFNAIEYILVEEELRRIVFRMNAIGDYDELDIMYRLMKNIYNKHNTKFMAYYFSCMQQFNRQGQAKNCVDKAILKMEILENVYADKGVHLNYILSNLSFTYVLAKYCKTLRKQNASHYTRYLNETNEMIKKCTDLLEYFTCAHNIKQFITDITEYLNSNDDDMYIENDGFIIEECE